MYHPKKSNRLSWLTLNRLVAAVPLVWLASTGAAGEDTADGNVDATKMIEEIVVTGTLIRGSEVVGSQTISLNSEDISEIGAITNNELLATIPQVANTFNERPDPSPRNTHGNSVNRPNLRGLPGFTAASGSTTLVLVDGHRGAPLGLIESSFDPDMIATGVIERVEIITDGGSSLYGTDAIGGVVNFITRDEFEGVKFAIDYGSGDGFNEQRFNLTAGMSRDRGSAYISFGSTQRDGLQRKDRDWSMLGDWDTEGNIHPSGTQCLDPAGSETRWFWYGRGWTSNPAAPGAGVFPVGEACDVEGDSTLMPDKDLTNVFASVNYELTDRTDLNVKMYYGKREVEYSFYPLGDTISGPTPAELGVVGAYVSQLYPQPALGFSYGAHPSYVHGTHSTEMDTWGITPELTFDISNDWQMRGLIYFGESETNFRRPSSNFLLLSDYVAAGAVDPADIAGTPAAVLNEILDWQSAGDTTQELFMARLLADGPVMNLPAGELSVAVGVEFSEDRAARLDGLGGFRTSAGLGSLSEKNNSRDIKSIFGELSVPVFDMLDLSISIRHDDYSDFGSATNPNIGFNFTPAEWITLYGHWGESFNAPTVVDPLNDVRSRNTPGQYSIADPNHEFTTDAEAVNPNAPEFGRTPSNYGTLQLLGTGELDPQTGEARTLGFAITPTEGLSVQVNYWEIDFNDALGAVNPLVDAAVLANPEKFQFSPTRAQVDAALAVINNREETVAFFATLNPDGLPGMILDRRTDNVDAYELRGVDFGADYALQSGTGLWRLSLSLVKYLESTAIQAAGETDLLDADAVEMVALGRIGWSRNNWSVNLMTRYTDGYDLAGTVTDQDSIGSFLVSDLGIRYDFGAVGGFAEGLSVNLKVDNVFDKEPEQIERNNTVPNAFTLGRVFKIGVSKTF